nr:hypothetical protein [Haloferax sp. ATB1]
MAVVDIPSVPDRLDDENVLLTVPLDDRSGVAGTKLVVWIPAELFEVVGGPVFRLVEFLYQPLLSLCLEPFQ